jgi:HSP20 family protein
MNTVKFNPFFQGRPFNLVMDEFFNRNLSDIVGGDAPFSVPSVNIKEDSSAYHLEMAAPGFDKSDFSIKLEKNQIIISVEKEVKNESTEKEGKWNRKEFHYGSFSRSFTLPETANTDEINAEYVNGVLLLTIAKKEEAKEKEPKVIEIK